MYGMIRRSSFRTLFALAVVVGCCADAGAAVFRVGDPFALVPPTHDSIQEAIDAALLAGGSNEIRVMAGTYTENTGGTLNEGSLAITGGWNGTYTRRDQSAAVTTIDGGLSFPVSTFYVVGGRLWIDGFTLQNGVAIGSANVQGGGMYLNVQGGEAFLTNNTFRDNQVLTLAGAATASGGGLFAFVFAPGSVSVLGNRFMDNYVGAQAGVPAYGGGIAIGGTGQARVIGNQVTGNTIAGGADALFRGAGVALDFVGGSLDFSNNRVWLGNNIVGPGASTQVVAGYIRSVGATMTLRRNWWNGNVNSVAGGVPGAIGTDVDIHVSSGGAIQFSDSAITNGTDRGLVLNAADTAGQAHLTNLAVGGYGETGLTVFQNGSVPVSVYNSVVAGNGAGGADNTSYSGVVDADYNVVTDGSVPIASIIDLGTNSPPGGLSDWDFRGHPRIDNGTVDIGPEERDHCYNGVLDADETNVDCGGSICGLCVFVGNLVRVVGGADYADIQEGYDAVGDGGTVLLIEAGFGEHVFCDRPIAMTLAGGFNSFGGTNDGRHTRILGSLTLNGGTVTVENLVVY